MDERDSYCLCQLSSDTTAKGTGLGSSAHLCTAAWTGMWRQMRVFVSCCLCRHRIVCPASLCPSRLWRCSSLRLNRVFLCRPCSCPHLPGSHYVHLPVCACEALPVLFVPPHNDGMMIDRDSTLVRSGGASAACEFRMYLLLTLGRGASSIGESGG